MSEMFLFLTRITTTPSGISVKFIRSPAFIPRLSRIGLGMVVWPLLVSVDSVFIVGAMILTIAVIVRNRQKRLPSLTQNMVKSLKLVEADPIALGSTLNQ